MIDAADIQPGDLLVWAYGSRQEISIALSCVERRTNNGHKFIKSKLIASHDTVPCDRGGMIFAYPLESLVQSQSMGYTTIITTRDASGRKAG